MSHKRMGSPEKESTYNGAIINYMKRLRDFTFKLFRYTTDFLCNVNTPVKKIAEK